MNISASSDHRRIKYSSLESSHRDESNGGDRMHIGAIDDEKFNKKWHSIFASGGAVQLTINWPALRKSGQHYGIISAETLKRNNFETCD